MKIKLLSLSSLLLLGYSQLKAQTTVTFTYTGAMQTYTVPSGITSITVDAKGAQGGLASMGSSPSGLGGRVQAVLTVTPGEILNLYVGGKGVDGISTAGGAGGFNGGGLGGTWSGGRCPGGGGGATDIRQGGNALSNRKIVAAGGGGTGNNYSTGDAGGNGGGLIGVNGLTGSYLGGGANQTAGGAPNGAFGVGGAGGVGQTGAGGGGGYYGGGGSAWEGGGGGSGYTDPIGVTSFTHTGGFQSGNGEIIITSSSQAAALNFDGTGDNVNFGSAISSSLQLTNKLTVEAWVKPTSTVGVAMISGNHGTAGTGNSQYFFRKNTNQFQIVINNGSTLSGPSAGTVVANTWQHVAGVWDGAIVSLYVNGVLTGTAVQTGSFPISAKDIHTGSNGFNEHFGGDIDELRIWNRALCQGEIQNNMNSELSLPQIGLISYHKFNQGIASSNNSTITTANATVGPNGSLQTFSLNGTTSNWTAPGGVVTGSSPAPFLTPTVSGVSSICSGSSTTLTASGLSTYTWTGGPTTATFAVSPTVTTTYSVIGTNSAGCISSYAVKTVTAYNCSPAEALNFDGSNDYINVPSPVSNDFTIEYWVKTTQTAPGGQWYAGNGIVDAEVAGVNNDFGTSLATNKIAFGIGAPDVTISSTTAINNGAWHHVAATWVRSSGAMKLYIDGNLEATGTSGTSARTASQINMGRLQTGSNYFNGDLDEVRIWNRALCQSEIQNNKNGELSLPQNSLVAYYKFNQGVNFSANPTQTTLIATAGTTGTLNSFALNGATSNWILPGAISSGSVAPVFLPISISGASVICNGGSTTFTASGAGISTYTWTSGPNTATYMVTPSVTTTYSVIGTNSVGCLSNIATKTLTVGNSPTISANSGSICSGNSFTINPSGASTYTIQGGSAVVTPTTAASYTVIGTSSLGCLSSNTATSNVAINANPTVTAISSNTTYICVGQSATLTANGVNTYTWNTSATTSVIAVSPTVTTSYTVTGSDLNGCTASAVISQSVSPCTGIDAKNSIVNFNIYPNPNNGTFTIDTETELNVTIVDVLGKTVYSSKLTNGKNQINLTNLVNGIYIVKAENNGKINTIRLIKE